MRKRKDIITVAIDSPAAAGAGTQAKLIAKKYNLFYLDTGKIYRFIGKLKIQNPKKFNYKLIESKIKNLKMYNLQDKSLLSDVVAVSASIIAKDKKIRKIVHNFQIQCAYNPPKKYNGSVLDGRDITSVIMKDAMFKFFITASVKTRAKRRFKEYKRLKKTITYKDTLKTLKIRDKSDIERKHGALKKTSDSVLINSDKLSRLRTFKMINNIMIRKLKA